MSQQEIQEPFTGAVCGSLLPPQNADHLARSLRQEITNDDRQPFPKELAKVISKRPGMYLGGTTYAHAMGFLTGLASLASLRNAPDEEAESDMGFSAENCSNLLTRISMVERDPITNDREAIRALEPLLAEALEEVL